MFALLPFLALAGGAMLHIETAVPQPPRPSPGPAPRVVAIPAADSVPLPATYFSPGRPGPAVIVFRNCDRDRSHLDAFATALSARGVHVLTWDYRPGEAPGLDWGATRLRDATSVFAWLVAQPGVDGGRVVAIGGSCGVSLALDFAAAQTASLRGLVVLSGPSDPAQRAFLARAPALAVLGAASVREGAAVPNVAVVVRASSHAESRLVTPADGGHGTEMLTHTPEFEAMVLDWITRRLA